MQRPMRSKLEYRKVELETKLALFHLGRNGEVKKKNNVLRLQRRPLLKDKSLLAK